LIFQTVEAGINVRYFSEGVGGRGRGQGDKGRSRGKGGEMTQTLYAHINKRKNKFKRMIGFCCCCWYSLP
jgi:hypothetical protein